mmetsp:Transcript_43/g.151  ORF Transcript_43/g.151 Transcript_43/m.151 type:complete len:267 (-) Transcript_43:212-1012(-)
MIRLRAEEGGLNLAVFAIHARLSATKNHRKFVGGVSKNIIHLATLLVGPTLPNPEEHGGWFCSWDPRAAAGWVSFFLGISSPPGFMGGFRLGDIGEGAENKDVGPNNYIGCATFNLLLIQLGRRKALTLESKQGAVATKVRANDLLRTVSLEDCCHSTVIGGPQQAVSLGRVDLPGRDEALLYGLKGCLGLHGTAFEHGKSQAEVVFPRVPGLRKWGAGGGTGLMGVPGSVHGLERLKSFGLANMWTPCSVALLVTAVATVASPIV